MKTYHRIWLVSLTVLAAACGSDDGSTATIGGGGSFDVSGDSALGGADTSAPADTGSSDAATASDSGAADTTAPDTGTSVDAGTPDTGAADTGAADTGAADTGAADTGAVDTGAVDTGAADTGAADTGAADTGVADTGAADTGAADTGTADTGTADTGTPDAGAPDVTQSKGKCDNPKDVAALAKADPEKVIGGCVFSCFSPSATCTNCLKKGLKVSDGCTGCFASIVECTVKNCALQCINATSKSCADCRNSKCFPAFVTCAGISPP